MPNRVLLSGRRQNGQPWLSEGYRKTEGETARGFKPAGVSVAKSSVVTIHAFVCHARDHIWPDAETRDHIGPQGVDKESRKVVSSLAIVPRLLIVNA